MFTKKLAETYDSQASKFSSTRRKHRPEIEHITQAIKTYQKQVNHNPTILEVGCGDGRLLKYIESVNYTGVDISAGLLTIAQKQFPHQKFIQSDMISYLQSLEKESVDVIVGIASVQHLFPRTERQKFFDLAQRVLKSGGQLILINRARSDRAQKKYTQPRYFHLFQKIKTRLQRSSGDQMVPRIDPKTKKTHQRYYHFFTLDELKNHTKEKNTHTLAYVDRDGSLTQSVSLARNSLLIATKDG